MNKEIIKAIEKKKKSNHTIRKWWSKNGYKIINVILFPIYCISTLKDKIQYHLDKKEVWNEEHATEILNYYIPRRSEWNAEDNSFHFFDNGFGWNIKLTKKYLKLKDRRFWKVNGDWWGGEIRSFLINKFELEGFTKELGDCSEGWTTITFILNEE